MNKSKWQEPLPSCIKVQCGSPQSPTDYTLPKTDSVNNCNEAALESHFSGNTPLLIILNYKILHYSPVKGLL